MMPPTVTRDFLLEAVSDTELLRRYHQGDLGSFEVVFGRHAPALLLYARSLLHEASHAEDVVQESFIRLMTYDPERIESGVRSFLCAVARNLITDERRRLAVRARTHPVPETRSSDAPADRRQERILSSLEQLPPEQRETVLLKIYADLTFEEVAKITGVPAPTCVSRYRYALQKLSQLLGED